MTDTWAAFVAARLDEDEAAAQAAQSRHPAPWAWKAAGPRGYLQELRDARGGYIAEFAGGADVRPDGVIHACRHDPARVLSRVEADRKLLRLLAGVRDVCTREVVEVVEGIVCDRAAIWSDHPDYPGRKGVMPAPPE